MMRTGICLLILQSLLLCSLVQAEPGAANGAWSDLIAPVQSADAGGDFSANGFDGGEDAQQAAPSAVWPYITAAVDLLPFHCAPLSRRCESHTIRAPPFPA